MNQIAGILCVALAILNSGVLAAQVDRDSQAVAIFRQRCISCHGENQQESNLRLDQESAALHGGDGGAVIVARSSDESELIRRVTSSDSDEWMPPDGERLSTEQVKLLQDWIDSGAAWPADMGASPVWSDNRLEHWAWQPIRSVPPPNPVVAERWSQSEIDRFIWEKLCEKSLDHSPPADRAILIRRVTFDLIGLPPSPDEVATFIADEDPNAYQKLVDRLLSSPRYGERWARHWLDVVHYADTHGYDKDQPRPNAWPYRDYVIRALNEDKPYGQFVAEQIAGDALYPNTRDGIEALGFIAAGPWDLIGHAEVPETKIDGKIARHLDRDDMVANALGTFSSVTIHCAQCHDHKFDPFTQDDYYSLHAVFAALDRADHRFYLDAEKGARSEQLLAQKANLVAAASDVQAKLADKANEGIVIQLQLEAEKTKAEIATLESELASLPAPITLYCGTVHQGTGSFCGTGPIGQPRPIHVLNRGNVQQPGSLAAPGALSALAMLPARFTLPAEHGEADRRAALARWLTDPQNPLTWRSIVNRIWQQHFGQGLVDTASDFGRMGGVPSHPDLLDWLATDFRDHGGSLKRLHKQIVLSAAYCQASASSDNLRTKQAAAIDADNRFLWRQSRRKLDAESIHDAVLACSGKLDLTMGGPGYQDFVVEFPEHSPHYEYSKADPRDASCFRRAVYRFIVRSQTQPFMTCLDCADPSLRVAKRNESVSPLQALTLLNNGFMIAQSEYFAERLCAEKPNDLGAQVTLAAQLAWGRDPTTGERESLIQFARENQLESLCRALFNSNEFVFVD